ncbi:hypothetical protein J7K99_01585 [bacterium]|nr:hypothetical protein [bacterium]
MPGKLNILILPAAFVVIGVSVALCVAQFRDIPRLINYQGKLFLGGIPLTDTVDIKYSLYDSPAGGTLLWEQNSNSVPVMNGLFSDTLGLRIDTVIAAHTDLWLEVSVNGVVLSPRERFYPAPFALTVADSAITDRKIRWGNSAYGVNAGDIPVIPLGNYYDAATVQEALDEIAKKAIQMGAPACSSRSYRLFMNY